MTVTPIGHYALLSDCRSAALVSRAGSVDWLCWPRFDSPSVLGRLLDAQAGHWSIRPSAATDDVQVVRRYRPRTMVLETTFRAPRGEVVVTDAMALGPNSDGHALAASAPRALLRSVTCRRGQVEVEVELAPRPEYGLIHPLMTASGGTVAIRGGADVMVLSASCAMTVDGSTARGVTSMREGDVAAFALTHRSSWEDRPPVWDRQQILDAIASTTAAWEAWASAHQNYEGPWPDLVYHSGSVLQALTFQPTGAIVAAPTTSLPEEVGGVRNWDYRYSWVRDASFTLEALWVAACPDEGGAFFGWMAGAVASQLSRGRDLQIMFGVGGERDLTERELRHLSGWRESRPVRIGNGAWNQRQLDVYGELVSAAHRLGDRLGELDPAVRALLVAAVDAAAQRWDEADQGIWEIRAGPRHFLYSKLMCWVALDRGIQMAETLHAVDRVEGWREERDHIGRAILDRGWSDRAGAFTQSFGSDDLDASTLQIPIVGFLPPRDPRVLSTIEAIEERLTDAHGLVYRYRAPDGVAGGEGTFLLCTFWLAQALALAGEGERARHTFSRAVAFVNDVGLRSEEVDPESRELLGNSPQAFSHIGLVNAAWAIDQAQRAR